MTFLLSEEKWAPISNAWRTDQIKDVYVPLIFGTPSEIGASLPVEGWSSAKIAEAISKIRKEINYLRFGEGVTFYGRLDHNHPIVEVLQNMKKELGVEFHRALTREKESRS